VQSKQLAITRCPAICNLSYREQGQIAALIRDGIPAGEAVSRYVARETQVPKSHYTAFRRLIRTAAHCLPRIEGRLNKSLYLTDEDFEVLRRLKQVTGELIRHRKSAKSYQEADFADLKKMVDEHRQGRGKRPKPPTPDKICDAATDMPTVKNKGVES